MTYDVIVIGAGCTGLGASRRLARGGVSVANVEAALFGGLITNVNELEGAFEGSGADLASSLMMEIADLGCATLSQTVRNVRRDDGAIVVGTDAAEHRARAAIVASGAALARLGVPGEAEYAFKGVSQCADCDGPMFQGEDVVVAGGGDSAFQEALVLSRYCARVRVLHRGAQPAARARWRRALCACDNVEITPHAEVTAIEGGDVVERVQARIGGRDVTIECAGVFAYVGLVPASSFLPSTVARDGVGAVITDASLESTLPGVYAAGAVRAGYGGTLGDAADEADRAADAVLRRLRG